MDQAGFAYDRQGNMVERHDGTGAYYDFDPENRLTAVRDGASNVVARYWYGPSGVRLAKAVGGVTNYFLYGSAGLLAEFDATGGVVRSYGYLPGAVFGGAPLYMKTSTTTAFFVLDHQGAPAMLVEGDGTIAWRLYRDAYGRAKVDPLSRLTCPLRASSQYADEESGLNYNLFRYYDPVLGRYINRDPIGEAGGINLYGFCANDPVGFVDPFGLYTSCDALSVGFILSIGWMNPSLYYELMKYDLLAMSADCFAGFADGMTMGATSWLRRWGGYDQVDYSSILYFGGEVASVAVDIAMTGGIKSGAAKSGKYLQEVGEKGLELARKRGVNRAKSILKKAGKESEYAGKQGHHKLPVKDGKFARADLAEDPSNIIFKSGHASVKGTAHYWAHARLEMLEIVDDIREATVALRHVGNAIMQQGIAGFCNE